MEPNYLKLFHDGTLQSVGWAKRSVPNNIEAN